SEDPPRHTAMRNIVNRGFTPRRIAIWEPRVREFTRAYMNEMRHAEEIDLVAAVAMPLPVRVICEILGVEPERRDDFQRWSDRIVAGTAGSARPAGPRARGSTGGLGGVPGALPRARARRTAPPTARVNTGPAAAQSRAR